MSQFYNNVKTALLLGLLTALILVIGSFFGNQGLIIALIFAAVMNFVSYFFSDKIALMTMRAYEVGPDHELYKIVQDIAARAGLPMPRVYVSPAAAPNAFATGRNPNHAAAQRIPLPVPPAMNGLFIAEPRNMMGTLANLFQTHPPLEQRLMNLIGRETV